MGQVDGFDLVKLGITNCTGPVRADCCKTKFRLNDEKPIIFSCIIKVFVTYGKFVCYIQLSQFNRFNPYEKRKRINSTNEF